MLKNKKKSNLNNKIKIEAKIIIKIKINKIKINKSIIKIIIIKKIMINNIYKLVLKFKKYLEC